MLRRGFLFVLCALLFGCSRKPPSSSGPAAAPPSRAEIWAAIRPRAERYHIEPAFIYALVAAESNFSPSAKNGDARGLLQLTPGAWLHVADTPYEPTVWNWRANLDAGIDYLAYLRSALVRKSHFTEPLWVAAFHDGLDAVEEHHFDLSQLPPPGNSIFEALWRGERAPVPPP